MHLRFRRAPPGGPTPAKLHDPPALAAGLRSGSCPISTQRADDTTRHITDVHSVRSDAGPVLWIRVLEWWDRTWGQVKSRAVSSLTATVLFYCVRNDHGVASADQRG